MMSMNYICLKLENNGERIRIEDGCLELIQEEKNLVYFNADGQPGRAIVTLQNGDAFTEKGVYFIEEQIKKEQHCESVILLNMIPLRG